MTDVRKFAFLGILVPLGLGLASIGLTYLVSVPIHDSMAYPTLAIRPRGLPYAPALAVTPGSLLPIASSPRSRATISAICEGVFPMPSTASGSPHRDSLAWSGTAKPRSSSVKGSSP